jgi:4-amino-4-deoxy-L-arabinose transferase-like glycosyltransferase
MRGKLLLWARRAHLYLGVFFTPLLLMFIVTGWWQTMASDDEKDRVGGFLHELMKKFSNVHTDDTWSSLGKHPHVWMMKWLVVAMCIGLIFSILLGLFLAWQTTKPKWRVILAFALGIAVPAVLIYIA